MTYTLAYGNTGGAATNVVLTDALPANLTYVANSATGTPTINGSTLTWSPGTLAARLGAGDFPGHRCRQRASGSTIDNTASISCTQVTTPVTSNTATVTVAASTAGRGDWWMFNHDPQHTGRSPFNGPASPVLKWQYATGASVYTTSAAIGADGTIYIGSDDGFLYALDGTTGTVKWQYNTGNQVWSSPAIGVDGTVYVEFFAFNPADGTLKWQSKMEYTASTSPVIGTDGTLYIGSDEGTVYAINSTNGVLKWQYTTGGTVDSSPALSLDGTVYVGSRDDNLYALDAATGTFKWKYPTGNWIDGSPSIAADGTVYFGSEDGYLYAINPADGSLKWKFNSTSEFFNTPVIGADGTVYAAAGNGVYALNPADGTMKWPEYKAINVNYSSPAIGADGTIYVGAQDNYLYALNPADGSLKWRYLTGNWIESSPAIGSRWDDLFWLYRSQHLCYRFGIAPCPHPHQIRLPVQRRSGRRGDLHPRLRQYRRVGDECRHYRCAAGEHHLCGQQRWGGCEL